MALTKIEPFGINSNGTFTFGNVSATGNVTGTYILGNGSQLTGLPEGYANANVAAYLPTYTGNLVSLTGNVTTTANISGNFFIGNGSQLTGLPESYGNANVEAYLPTYTGNLASLQGNVTTTANISGNFFIGNGSQLTGLPEGYGNANVEAYLPTYTGNLTSLTGNVTTTANISGNFFIGNGSQLTGLPEGYGNANVEAYLPTYTGNLASLTGNVTTTANISGNFFIGNGSQLTGIEAGAVTTFSSTAPSSPAQGDIWIESDSGIQYIYFNDGTSSQWAEMEAQTSFASGGSGNVDFESVSSNILPAADVTYDLGSATYRWRDIYLSGNTINLGGATIKTDAASGAIALIPEPTVTNPNPSGMVVSPSGGITVVSTVGGEVSGNAIANAAASPTAAPVPIDITTTPPANGQALIWDAANTEFVPGNVTAGGSTVTVYNNISNLPLANVPTGSMAFVNSNNRLYLWNGTGWFNIALINTNPTITSGPDPSYLFATNGTPIVLTLTASDPEGIPITWSYEITSGTLGNTATIVQNNNVFTITPSTNQANIGIFQVTFIASDGINIATAASTFRLAFSALDPFYNESVLLTTTAVNNGTNNTFVDSSSNNITITRDGNTTQGTVSPFSPAGWGAYFDGTGDYLSSAVGTSLNVLANTDFTVEGWCYLDSRVATRPAIFSNYNSFTTGGLSFWAGHGSSTITQFQVGLSGTFPALNAGTIPYNSWFHWAIVRNGTGSNNITVYINGTSIGTISSNVAITSTGNTLWLGASGDTVANAGINGYMSNFRWVTGSAVYTTNFTPPTSLLTAIAGTSLLTLQSNRFVDNSANNFTITRIGDTRVAPWSPFLPITPYVTDVAGGSASFNGSTTGLLTASNANLSLGTGDFTMEAWIYPTATAVNWQQIVGPTYGANNVALLLNLGVNLVAYTSSTTLTWSNIVRPFEWNHVVLTRQSGVLKMFHNGVEFTTTAAFSNNMNETVFAIGRRGAGGEQFAGQISGVRVVRGTAVYTSSFALPSAPPTAVAGTVLLLNFTNSNIIDQTAKVVVDTVGDARVSTSVVRFSSSEGSMFFDGTGDYLTIPNNPIFNFRSGNFTVECWIRPSTVAPSEQTIAGLYGYTDNRRSWDIALTGTNLRIRTSTAGTAATISNSSSNSPISAANTWYYIAYVRNGSTLSGYVNGVQVVSASVSGSLFLNTVDPLSVGAVGPLYTGFFAGHISDFRITNGIARYTANFTPPTEPLGYNNPE
jgi:Concanavalin A-like lectin/glucanases superfamily